MKKIGFTLAEVLMTLTIIGIVAAITLPSLTQDMQKHALEKQILKFYNQVQTFAKTHYAENMGSGFADVDDAVIRREFNVIDICENAEDCPDIANLEYKAISNSDIKQKMFSPNTDTTWPGPVYTLADGTVFQIMGRGMEEDELEFIFDANGTKGPNTSGYDFFKIHVYYDGSVAGAQMDPWSRINLNPKLIKDKIEADFESCKKGEDSLYGTCFEHFMQNKFKFDY